MNAYICVLLAFVTMVIGSFITYGETYRSKRWFAPSLIVLGMINYYLWALVAKWCDGDKRTLYSLSTLWDVATIASYNVLPLLFFGVKLNAVAWFGFAMVCSGALLIKQSQ